MQFKSLTIKDDDDLLVFLREEILVSYREDIDAGSIFGIDGLFPDALLETFRVELFKYSEMMPPKNHGCALQDISHKENFHRIDDSPSKSRAPHIYQTFVFGDLPNLTGSLGDGAKLIFSKMLAVQNAFAQTGAKFGTIYLDKYHLRPQVIRYPSWWRIFGWACSLLPTSEIWPNIKFIKTRR